MGQVEEEDIAAVIMSIDYEKAFDFLEWGFIAKTLKFFGFGEAFIKWISTLYKDASSCVLNNGWTTQFFKTSRGVRQGCPMSPYLFILCAEIFAIEVRKNKDIEGIKIGEETHKIIQFADDTALTLKYEQNTLQEICNTLSGFSQISGLSVNLEKTTIMRIGSIKYSDCKIPLQNNIQWTNDYIKLLGTVIPNDRSRLTELNYTPKLQKVENIIRIWKSRNLTLYGRVQLTKTYLISQVIYLLSVLPTPDMEFLKKFETLLFKFIWNNKTERIKRSTLYRNNLDGGIKMPHLPSFNYALKLAWLRRLLDVNNKGSWKTIVLYKLPITEQYLWECNLNIKDLPNLLKKEKRTFWTEVLEAWCLFNFKEPTDLDSVRKQQIWFNSFIKIDRNVLFYKNWYSHGICTIQDLLNNNSTFMTYEQFTNRYNIRCNYLTYYGVITAIPKEWKIIIQRNVQQGNTSVSNMQKLMKMDKVCKGTYEQFLDKLLDTKGKLQGLGKWEKELECSVEDSTDTIFGNMYKCTRSRKLQTCQFHILHRSLVTNVDLFKWQLKDENYCTFCKDSPETIKHLIIDCPVTYVIWENINDWLKRKTGIHKNITRREIVFGCCDETSLLYDLIILVVKQYIYKCRCLEKKPTFIELIHHLKIVRDTEHKSAEMYGKMNIYLNKWSPLTEAFI